MSILSQDRIAPPPGHMARIFTNRILNLPSRMGGYEKTPQSLRGLCFIDLIVGYSAVKHAPRSVKSQSGLLLNSIFINDCIGRIVKKFLLCKDGNIFSIAPNFMKTIFFILYIRWTEDMRQLFQTG
jgi:hypothetical protein